MLIPELVFRRERLVSDARNLGPSEGQPAEGEDYAPELVVGCKPPDGPAESLGQSLPVHAVEKEGLGQLARGDMGREKTVLI